jgi:hypothetical protein
VNLASLADVKSVLNIPDSDTSRDARLRQCLAAVQSWVEPRLTKLTAAGQQCATYWDVPEDATLHLPANDVTVLKVRVFEYPSSYGVPLSPVELGLGHGYDLTDDGALFLRPTLSVSPFEGATAQRRLRQYVRVEVHYLGTGVVPRAVTEGIAFLTAGYFMDGPRALKGITSERIGDYSYTLGGSVDEKTGLPSFVARAAWLLEDFMRKNRVQVI